MKRVAVVLLPAFRLACGGASDETEPDCPTPTPGATATTSVDPRCVERATETQRDDNPEGQLWQGTVLQVYRSFCTARARSPVDFKVAPDGRFTTTVAFTEVGSDCPMPTANLWGSQTVTGQLTQDRLNVEGAPTLAGTADRTGDRVSGTYTNASPMDANQTYTTTWELQCEKGCG